MADPRLNGRQMSRSGRSVLPGPAHRALALHWVSVYPSGANPFSRHEGHVQKSVLLL